MQNFGVAPAGATYLLPSGRGISARLCMSPCSSDYIIVASLLNSKCKDQNAKWMN